MSDIQTTKDGNEEEPHLVDDPDLSEVSGVFHAEIDDELIVEASEGVGLGGTSKWWADPARDGDEIVENRKLKEGEVSDRVEALRNKARESHPEDPVSAAPSSPSQDTPTAVASEKAVASVLRPSSPTPAKNTGITLKPIKNPPKELAPTPDLPLVAIESVPGAEPIADSDKWENTFQIDKPLIPLQETATDNQNPSSKTSADKGGFPPPWENETIVPPLPSNEDELESTIAVSAETPSDQAPATATAEAAPAIPPTENIVPTITAREAESHQPPLSLPSQGNLQQPQSETKKPEITPEGRESRGADITEPEEATSTHTLAAIPSGTEVQIADEAMVESAEVAVESEDVGNAESAPEAPSLVPSLEELKQSTEDVGDEMSTPDQCEPVNIVADPLEEEIFEEITKKAQDTEDELYDLEDESSPGEEKTRTEKSISEESTGDSAEISIGEDTDSHMGAAVPPKRLADSENPMPPISEEGATDLIILPTNGTASRQSRRRGGCWTVFATSYLLASLLVFVLVLGIGAFAWFQQDAFKGKFSNAVSETCANKGLYVGLGAWRYDFARGVVFDEISLYADKNRMDLAIKISGADLRVDPVALIQPGSHAKVTKVMLQGGRIALFHKGKSLAVIKGVDAEFRLDESDIIIQHFSGGTDNLRLRLNGSFKLPEASAHGGASAASTADSLIDLTTLDSLLPWFAFQLDSASPRLPLLSLSFSADRRTTPSLAIEGSLQGERLKWEGIDFQSLSLDLEWNSKTETLRFPRIQAACASGIVGGSLIVDWKKRELSIPLLESSANFIDIITAYKPAWETYFSKVHLADPPIMQLAGKIPMDEPKNSSFEVIYTHRGGLSVPFAGKDLPLQDIRGRFTYDKGVVDVKDAAGVLFRGQIQVLGSVNVLAEGTPFTGMVTLGSVPVDEISPWIGNVGKGVYGMLNLKYRGNSTGGMAHLNGSGTLRVEGTTLNRFPVFGAVRAATVQIIPAFAGSEKEVVEGSFLIESDVFATSDLTATGDGSKIVCSGSVPLETQKVNFTAEVSPHSSLATALKLKDKSITLEGSGTLLEPELALKHFPLEFAQIDLGSALGTASDTLESLRDLVMAAKEPASVLAPLPEGSKARIFALVSDLIKEIEAQAEPAPTPALRAIPSQ